MPLGQLHDRPERGIAAGRGRDQICSVIDRHDLDFAFRPAARGQRGREEAAEAEMIAVRATAFEPGMIEIARAMLANELPHAEALLLRNG
jgi:hypothetical protein